MARHLRTGSARLRDRRSEAESIARVEGPRTAKRGESAAVGDSCWPECVMDFASGAEAALVPRWQARTGPTRGRAWEADLQGASSAGFVRALSACWGAVEGLATVVDAAREGSAAALAAEGVPLEFHGNGL